MGNSNNKKLSYLLAVSRSKYCMPFGKRLGKKNLPIAMRPDFSSRTWGLQT